jgi:uroporphyrinogen decarboxylase
VSAALELSVPDATPRFLAALRREPVDRPPVWIMRQAGRYLPEYQATRARAGSFLALCTTPELATEVTLQPIRRFALDAAIVFSDILLPLRGLGVRFDFPDSGGPRLAEPLAVPAAWERLASSFDLEPTECVAAAIRLLRRALPAGTPLIGFCGAPWTLAAYLVEGGGSKEYAAAKGAALAEPEAFARLLDTLADAMAAYLRLQVEAGAQAVQVFDSWAGVLSAGDYAAIAAPPLRRLLAALSDLEVPRVVYAGGTSHLLPVLADLPCEAVGVDWRTDLGHAGAALRDKAVQGNLDPAMLLAPPAAVDTAARRMVAGAPRRGYVANLGHGILPGTPIAAAEAFLAAVRAGA